ncbi:hypothetical protein [Bacillus cereus]|uniref:hypothetical protein n=1 Tax=Bacillus cereus TaxID=1396 RepID=UPI0018CE3FB6|nr:hypothetical protein [Bacillus cereus]MBG9611829.1 hypothetical protein [Bacillus cereus]
MDHLTPQAEGRLVDRLISLKLTENQFNQLARSINEFPENIFSKQFTNEQRADVLVSRANQKGNYHLIEDELERMFLPSTRLINATSVDTYLAFDFGRLYQELLKSLETIELIEKEEEGILNSNFVKHIEFKVKLRYKAKFQASTRKLGLKHKNDNSVLQRKAQKLGYQSYREIDDKVSQLYQEIMIEYPVGSFPPEKRLNELLKKLCEFIPEEYRNSRNTTDYLYGIIFGTTAQCLIFNE